MSFAFFCVLSNKINNSLNSRSTAPFLEGIDKFPLSKINLFVFSSCEEPKTSFEFKMKSEFSFLKLAKTSLKPLSDASLANKIQPSSGKALIFPSPISLNLSEKDCASDRNESFSLDCGTK